MTVGNRTDRQRGLGRAVSKETHVPGKTRSLAEELFPILIGLLVFASATWAFTTRRVPPSPSKTVSKAPGG